MKNKFFLIIFAAAFFALLFSAQVFALRLPGDAPPSTIENLNTIIDNQRSMIMLLVVLLSFSILANILVTFSLFRAQNLVREAVSMRAHINLLKEAALKCVSLGRGEAPAEGIENATGEEIEVIRSGDKPLA
ncbi:MAG: hypothetical protein M1536_03015 [Firmicutes bacterium]|nr:hypothetical protein [Bacillota bacterium]